ncbi:DUF2017 domain-containing protein [Brachybacterium faecium]|uniref:Uncharacterized protein n=1 Tax=Brachybacterium faecium (strain ATCC 43885 / DSM 4810 / JCM 11609 / LMG 19847 / NBRC 14762 / NCIMB 9860 / 6-10) TaxID=446465 RepID=C7ME09_BRAFD|nr:DUF2017 domain-containing protein [Brachybacterium faecium]ACU85816.1 protein of unknown function (DUF2017) [Brachybacterium faecium DSM 4810]SLN01077.1 DUF2017 domain-containing protein [Brachybacterium faecium]HJG53115.1 DUF2017 domain-containing protein [Brachybacterium faecium]
MAHAFRRRADGTLACRLDGEEKAIIAQVAQETADLIRADLGIDAEGDVLRRAAQSEDPLRRLEAEFAGRDARDPSDSAVKRLFPAASEDPTAAAEFRRLGQQDLADGKLADLRLVMTILDRTGGGHSEVVVDEAESLAMLRALNDVRIVLADRLGLQRDGDFDTVRMLQQIGERVEGAGPSGDDEHVGSDIVIAVYELLSWLQESLLRALD